MTQWHCSVRGMRYGPVSQEQVLSWMAEGRIRSDDLVWHEGMADWAPAGSVPELAAATTQAGPVSPPSPGAAPGPPGGTYLKPHRGVAVLVLGICGLVVCVICGIIAWVMANTDLREMAAGTMDPAGESMTKAGKICAIVGVILNIVVIGLWLLAVVVTLMYRPTPL